ncbi:MAG: Rrf2 family transcriptional regulator [Marinilabiliaceae bacterium]|jgi:Rrf2 family protein|nr:Rrf2 family transcriptional regulator [Marinilabiliaceae bacterium]
MLSKSTEYAIRALIFVQLQNLSGERPGVAEIAREIEAPVAFTAKILHTLTSRKVLNSMKGRGGGFFFSEERADLTVHEIIFIMEGDALFTECGIGLSRCSDDNPCPLHDQYGKIRDQLLALAKLETINSMAEKIKTGQAVLNRITQNNLTKV